MNKDIFELQLKDVRLRNRVSKHKKTIKRLENEIVDLLENNNMDLHNKFYHLKICYDSILINENFIYSFQKKIDKIKKNRIELNQSK
jgi:hypothetical protein